MAPSFESVPTSHQAPPAKSPAKSSATHPFAPLSAGEITTTAQLIRQEWPASTDLHFKTITLQEPAKLEVIPLLDAENNGRTFTPPQRKSFVNYYIRNTNKFHEATVNLSESKVESNVRLGLNIHSPLDGEEIVAIEKAMLEHPAVQAEVAKLKLPDGAVIVIDPWIYGSDGVDDDARMAQGFMYLRDPANPSEEDSNHYALPLSISPVFDFSTRTLVRIDTLPTGADSTTHPPKPYKQQPPNEYIPEGNQLRTDLKPLHVVQPEGASFKVTEQGTSNVIDWQKWSFRIGFNVREGPVLYNVRYDGRSIFYRLSLSDMNVPYGDPRPPFHRKSAFDLGDTGAGAMANNLKLGCDCLGSIYYLSGVLNDDKGEPLPMENCVCIHEQDNGISWKHTNYRTGRAVVARNRELVVQTIITVANYEYILAFIFNQAGEFHYEVRATGILSTQPVDEGVTVPFGTIVHPGVLATYHQHIFSLRIDPMIEGHSNRLVYTEAHPIPRHPVENPHGTGYTSTETLITHSGGYDSDFSTNRTFKIQNTSVKNPINGLPVAYKLHVPPFQKGLADSDSFNFKRAEFNDRSIYAVRHRDGEFFAGGKYTNQSRGGEGVRSWADRHEDIVDQDLVLFVQFGINHLPRAEDFPVMPCEVLKVSLKPVNFFERNPAIDVPPSDQKFNKSTLLSDRHHQPVESATVVNGATGEMCCNGNGANGTNGANGANGTNGTNGH